MKANEKSLDLFKGQQTRFVIPFFQRSYVWDEDNWARLLESLESSNSSHYLGSIIIKDMGLNKEGYYESIIIDGQQRVTTLSILFRAIADSLDNNYIRDMLFLYLFIKRDPGQGYTDENTIVKLESGIHDQEVFDLLIRNPDDAKVQYQNNKLVNCYAYFMDELKDKDRANKLVKLLTDDMIKFIVEIRLDQQDNEQAIFDVANGTGVSLTCADIIKNDLFLRFDENDRENKYLEKWEPTFDSDENCYNFWASTYNGRSNIENLFFSVAQILDFNDGKIYDVNNDTFENLSIRYKSYFDNKGQNEINSFLEKLCKYANIYRNYLTVDKDAKYSEHEEIPRCIFAFSRLKASTVLFPYFLKLFEPYCNEFGEITNNEDKIIVQLRAIERILIRANIVENCLFTDKKEKPSNKNFNKTVAKVVDSGNVEDLYTVEQMSAINDDSKVKEGLQNIDNNTASIILFLLNLKKAGNLGKSTNVKEFTYNYELEHIMPQEYEAYWGLPNIKDENGNVLSDEEKRAYRKEHIYQIGNMTIITPKANKQIKNYDIKTKMQGNASAIKNGEIKKGYRGYEMVAIELISKDFIDKVKKKNYKWDERMITERTKAITSEILEYWK